MRIPLTATRLSWDGTKVTHTPAGLLTDALEAHLNGQGPPGLVVLGSYGSGKTTLCNDCAEAAIDGMPLRSVVPLRQVARQSNVQMGLLTALGSQRSNEAASGERVLLLDGLDEVARPGERGFSSFFTEVTACAGPRWVLTSRPGHFRTDEAEPEPDQVDVLGLEHITLLRIDPLPLAFVRQTLSARPGGAELLESVQGLEQLVTSPILLHVVEAAWPFIEPGRPIQPWGVFDAWIRHALDTGEGHDVAMERLVGLCWRAFRDTGVSSEGASFCAGDVAELELPSSLRSALLVTDLDGRLRLGHRSVYEFLVSTWIAPRVLANQGHGPDELTGLHLSEATRAFLVGQVGKMPVIYDGDRVRIPRGNYVSGGDHSSDERPLLIRHVAEPFWISRAPVTNADWGRFLDANPDDRIDAHYLPQWGIERTPPADRPDAPVYNIWPSDADSYAAWAGGRLPSASEWEKATRGLDGRLWPWGDYWVRGAAVTSETGVERPLPARAFGAQGDAGLFSAVGGVFEYTSSLWRGRQNRGRVVMGGCFTHDPSVSRTGLRLSHKLSGNLKAGLRLTWPPD